jgi:hypothetical protein
MKKVAILQSNYIPWKGYFDIIAAVDEFIFYDEVQFTKNDWRNRNQIKTPSGLCWLTVPVGRRISRRICDVSVQDNSWQEKHWKTLLSNYGRARHFDEVAAWLVPFYLDHQHENLSGLNQSLIKAVCDYLNISTILTSSKAFSLAGDRSEKLLHICQQAGACTYVSGPSAACYLDERLFEESGIKVEWFNYSGYPVYPQLWGEFVHNVSVLDLIFNCGNASSNFMKFCKQ